MHQEQLLKALDDQLAAMSRTFSWGLPIVLVGYWNAANESAEVDIAGVVLRREQIFHFTCVLFFLVASVISMRLGQLGDLLKLIDKKHSLQALTLLSTHHWGFNPFSVIDVAHQRTRRLLVKFFLVTVAWWFFCASLLPLALEKTARLGYVALFFAIGAAGIFLVLKTLRVCEEKAETFERESERADFRQWFASVRKSILAGAVTGSVVGGAVFLAALTVSVA